MKTRKSLRDTIAETQQGMDSWANAFGKPKQDMGVPEAKKPRAPSKPSEIPSEHEEQKSFVKWFHVQYPKVLIFAVPNAAMRDFKLAAWLTSEGMFKGIPDLHIPAWKTVIEFKRIRDRLYRQNSIGARATTKALAGITSLHTDARMRS